MPDQVKLVLYIVLFGMISSGVLFIYSEIKTGGENKCKVETQEIVDEKTILENEELKESIKKMRKTLLVESKKATELAEQLKQSDDKRRKLAYDIGKFEEIDGCTNLGGKFLFMLNESIGKEPRLSSIGDD